MASGVIDDLHDDISLEADLAPGGVIVYYADGDEEIVHVNQYVVEMMECESKDEFLRLTGGTFRGFVYDDDRESTNDSIWGQVDRRNNLDHVYYRVMTKTGRLITIDDYGRLVQREGARPVFYVFLVEMTGSSLVDWLTGLPGMNRFHTLAQSGAKAMRERGTRPATVALDLVGLKAFNTQYGRDGGDRLLQVFGDLLRSHFGNEACSRFSEDHFYAYSSEETMEGRLRALFEDFATANGGKVLPVRAGAYVCDDEDDIVAIGFDRAKFACDYDRVTWHSHLTWFDDEMRKAAQLRIYVLDRIDQAIEEGWIRPHYQAILRSTTGCICGEEALARWEDPKYGMLSPIDFIPVLEESDLLYKVDLHMIDCVIGGFKRKEVLGVNPVPISVNISIKDFAHFNLVEVLNEKLEAAGVPRKLLCIELTESAASDDPETFKAQVAALRNAGYEVWLDDFGSGYSSLNTLQGYDFDLIKLDMEFVRDVDNPKACEIVQGVIAAATKLGVATLAEGIETYEQAQFLESVGCNMLQGFFFTRPLPLECILGDFIPNKPYVSEFVEEKDYWNAVDAVDLLNPSENIGNQVVDGALVNDLPAGVMEKRGETWSLLRANRAFRVSLDRAGVMPLERSNLKVQVFDFGVDEELSIAAQRCLHSGDWERIAGCLDFESGVQFCIRNIASFGDALAFAVVSVPSMLGSALGVYGDVPVAYAVLRALYDDEHATVADAEYVFANNLYCRWSRYDTNDIVGRSFTDLTLDDADEWLSYIDQAVRTGTEVYDVMYSAEVDGWLSFGIVPSPVDGYFVFSFMLSNHDAL